jgi:hypothetical protein
MFDVGFQWPSKEGVREIVARREVQGNEVFLVTTGGGRLSQIIRISEIEYEIRRDTKNYESRQKALREQQINTTQKTEHESWYGFTDRLNPAARARAIAVLEGSVRRNGVAVKRGDLIVLLVKEGWKVRRGSSLGRLIEDSKTGSYLLERDVTKTALDLAEFLSR